LSEMIAISLIEKNAFVKIRNNSSKI